MSEVSTSRRDVMRALAIVPAIATPAIARAALTRAPAMPSRAITEKVAAYHNAVTAQNEWERRVYSPAWKACQAEQEAIPHLTTEGRSDLVTPGTPAPLSTNNPGHLSAARMYKSLTQDGHRLGGREDRTFDEFLQKLDWREAEKKHIADRHNMDALDEEQDRLNDVSYRAMRAVEDFRVTTLADLIAKVGFSQETDGQIDHDDLLTDLRRIAREA